MEVDKIKLESCNLVEDVSLDKGKASSEETLSCGDVNSLRDVSSADIVDDKYVDKAHTVLEVKEPPTLFRPLARVSAFSAYTSLDGSHPAMSIPMQGLLSQASKPGIEFSKMLEGIYGCDQSVPQQCGHGCCAAPNGKSPKSSLLGPEFVEFSEAPPFPNLELASIATDISNLAWLRSGLENRSANMMGDSAGRVISHGSQVHIGH